MKRLYKNIFILDDNSTVLRLLEEAFKDNEMIHKIKGFSKGSVLLDYVSKTSFFKEDPDIIMLDLYMPELSGFDITRKLREIPALNNIPIIILSDSQDQKDIEESYTLGANLFLQKPATYDAWIELIKTVDSVSIIQAQTQG